VELAFHGYITATIMFEYLKQYDDLEWLKRSYKTMHDTLSIAPAYQWVLAEGRAEGKAEGKAGFFSMPS